MTQVGHNNLVWHQVTPVVDTSAYASGDVMAIPIAVPDVFTPFNPTILLQSLQVLDKDDDATALDVVLMSGNGSLGALNAAVGPTDTVAATIKGIVAVVAGDYVDLGNSQLATPQFNPIVIASDGNSKDLYLALISRAIVTKTSAADIVVNLGFLR